MATDRVIVVVRTLRLKVIPNRWNRCVSTGPGPFNW